MQQEKGPNQQDELARKAEQAGMEVSLKQKREMVRFTLRETSGEEWERIKAMMHARLSYPQMEDEFRVLELVMRGWELESNLDRKDSQLTHGSAKALVFKCVDRIVQDEKLMGLIGVLHGQLNAMPDISREDLRWALYRMPREEREHVFSLIPSNPFMEDRGRDVRFARDVFENDLSHEELARKYELTVNGVKATIGDILGKLRDRPLARMPALKYIEKASRIEPMSPTEVRDRLRRLDSAQRRGVIEAIPTSAWMERDIAAKHKQITIEYFEGEWPVSRFAKEYGRRHGEELGERAADNAIANTVKRIAGEPDLVERLRSYSGGPTAKAEAGLAEVPAKPVEPPVEAEAQKTKTTPKEKRAKPPEKAKAKPQQVPAKKVSEGPIAEVTVKELQGLGVRPPEIESPEDFDNFMRWFIEQSGGFAGMLKAAKIEQTPRLQRAMQDLSRKSETSSLWKDYPKEVVDKGQMIPALTALIRTKPPEWTMAVVGHLEDSFRGYSTSIIGLQDVPRLALYAVAAYHVGISEGVVLRNDELGSRYRDAAIEYNRLTSELSASEIIRAEYNRTQGMYVNIVRAIDPKLDMKVMDFKSDTRTR